MRRLFHQGLAAQAGMDRKLAMSALNSETGESGYCNSSATAEVVPGLMFAGGDRAKSRTR